MWVVWFHKKTQSSSTSVVPNIQATRPTSYYIWITNQNYHLVRIHISWINLFFHPLHTIIFIPPTSIITIIFHLHYYFPLLVTFYHSLLLVRMPYIIIHVHHYPCLNIIQIVKLCSNKCTPTISILGRRLLSHEHKKQFLYITSLCDWCRVKKPQAPWSDAVCLT